MARICSSNPIVGRERDQARLRQLLDDAIDGRGGLVLISGEAGIGKTTLVHDLIASAHARDCHVLTGGCYDLTTTPPYGPWSEVLRGYQPQDDQPPVPAWFGDPDAMGQVGSQAALFEETRRFFAGVADIQPLIIILEDLHWSDAATLEALRFLARTLRETAVLFVVTYRDDEITRRHELYQLLPLLVRESQAQRIHLHELDHGYIHDLVGRRYKLPEADLSRLVNHVFERSEGNPFFAEEILQGLVQAQVLQSTSDGWTLGNLEYTEVPVLLRQALDIRLAQLPTDTRSALQVASVIGQTISVDLWQELTGLDDSEFEQAMVQALEAQVLEDTATGNDLQFRHALIREVLYEALTIRQHRARHRKVAEALAELPNPDPDAVAHHFREAADERAIDWLVQAGSRAERSYAWSAAASRYMAAVERLEGIEERRSEQGWLLFRLAMALRWIDPERGLVYHREAIQIAELEGDQVLASLSRGALGLLMCFAGKPQQGIPEMEEAVATLQTLDLDDWSAFAERVAPGKGTLLLWLSVVGRYEECIQEGERDLSGFDRFEDHFVAHNQVLIWEPLWNAATQVATTCSALGMSYAMLGQPHKANPLMERAIGIFKAIDHHVMVGNSATSVLSFITIPFHLDDPMQCEYWADQAHAGRARAQRALPDDDVPRLSRLPLLVVEGGWDEVNELAPLHLRATANVTLHTVGLSARARVAREQGNAELAWQQIRAAFPRGADTKPGNHHYPSATELQIVAANLSLDAHDIEQAQAWIESFERWLEWSGAVVGRSEVHLLQARYQSIVGDMDAVHHHAKAALACASDPRQPLALIAAHRLLGELAAKAGRYNDATENLQASLELAERCRASYEKALTTLTLAELATTQGNSREATHHLREARTICEQLGAKRSLIRADQIESGLRRRTIDHPAGLSNREVEVLEHAASGMTNAKIGEALFISPRTVGQHLQSVYNKLSVSNRAAAVARWAELTQEAEQDSADG